jgi:hypothetical protein
MVYYEGDPFGFERGDIQAARICAILAEIHRNRDMRLTPYEIKDFMPDYSKASRRQQSPGDMLNLAKEITLAMGGTVNLPNGD